VREAVTLPTLLLTSALLASVRVGEGGALRFVGPTLLALVLATVLAALLVRAGVLDPERLVGPDRRALANANGGIVLIALVFAAAQIFTALMPETGLMAVLFAVFHVALLGTVAAARPAGARLVQALATIFGGALVLRFVLLNALSAPDRSLAGRLFATAVDGLTLGALGLEYHAPPTGYAVFASLVSFFAALLLLPNGEAAWALLRGASERDR
jgi:hypothetical protein